MVRLACDYFGRWLVCVFGEATVGDWVDALDAWTPFLQ